MYPLCVQTTVGPFPTHLVGRCTVRAGKAELARKAISNLARLCIENEPGLLVYQFYFNETETELWALETYKDNDAILNHGKKPEGQIETLFDDFLSAVQITDLGFFGAVSQEVMDAKKVFNPTVYKYMGGVTR